MNLLNSYKINAADWRHQLQINDRRTTMVICLFVAIYLLVGLIVDIYFHQNFQLMSFSQAFYFLITFQVVPTASLIMLGVALLSVFVTFSLHDKIMMLGTDYYEVTQASANSQSLQQLLNIVEELRIAAGLKFMPKIYIIEADYMNAFASGYSEKSALIAITRGLLAKLSRSELQAVIAHELSHIRHHDIKLTLFAVVLSNIMLIVIDMLFYNALYGGGRRNNDGEKRDDRVFVIIMLLRFILPLLTVVLMLYLSRTREYMADAGAVELTRDNTPLALALIKIHDDTASHQDVYERAYNQISNENIRLQSYIFDPTQAGVSIRQATATMFSTHPSLDDRLKAIGFTK